MRKIKNPILILLIVLLPSISIISFGDGDKDVENIPKHHTSAGFQNYPFIETAAPKGFLFYMRRFWGSVFTPDIPKGHALPESEAIRLLGSIQGDSITWLGHASFLIKVAGVTILTDPFLTEFASPISWAGPRRFVDPGISLQSLPQIDIIIVSHSHYDHLDDLTVRSLNNKDSIQIVVPLGLKYFFLDRGFSKVVELDWEEYVTVENVKFTALPSVHDSARSTSDHNETLWASWAIEGLKKKILFIGDTGYSETIFKNIGNEYKQFDFVIVPIGAYAPRNLMWMSHVTPEEAVAIGRDVHANALIASHWGTVSSLSDEPMFEPPKRFNKAGKDSNFSDQLLWVMKIGESRSLD